LPEHLDGGVYRCGYTSESSFGAVSYFFDNILVDSPRFAAPLVKNFEAMGGVRRLLLTHQDDVADHEKFHARFGCERVLHRDDVRTKTAGVELTPSGLDPIELEPGLVMIPTPGHRSASSSPAITSRGALIADTSTHSKVRAGIRGASRYDRWSVCSTITLTGASNGCCRATAAQFISTPSGCTPSWNVV
jgi:glyoxylase-like metal-dependent hydrolase (beta-lactamase superfamily II)